MSSKYGYIEDNLIKLKNRVAKICSSCSRDPKEIYIVAVSKTFPADAVASAVDYNQLDFGENRVQELLKKEPEFQSRIIHWHLIGHLQTNKVKYIVPFVFLIHSVDSLKLAQKIQQEALKAGKIIKCLIQVNTSGEDQKSGCDPKYTLMLAKEISQFENIKLKGLMTVGKMINNYKVQTERDIVRSNFKQLKELFEEIKSHNIPRVDMKYLSMGMTSDYDIAIEEGANMLRIGSAIFGKRTDF
ncbi:MAG: YggS family pyridoxal phosphate-dependent enzyme [Ignavibacteria bacterium]|nr:YggS family pyridoxal phosphate-dependent enzyme [Ignavibacteria bacterium]